MFLRCVSELVIESREVRPCAFLPPRDCQCPCPHANVMLHATSVLPLLGRARGLRVFFGF